ncbi:MAG: ABC transporter permease [Candidatus Zixiibacteriota bacterium]
MTLSGTRLWAIARKEVTQLRRDTRSLVLAFLLPVSLLVLFGYAITWDVNDIKTAVVDQDMSPRSRELIEAFTASGYFTITEYLNSMDEVDDRLSRGTDQIVLVIPPDFSANLGGGDPALLQALVDGSDANTATIILSYTEAIVTRYSTAIALQGQTFEPPLVAESRVWYNEELTSRNMIVPGLVAVIMMIIAAMLTSLTIAREWERGTMEQLAATPVTRIEVVIGKLLPYLAIGLIDVIVCSVMGVWLFDVPFRGNPALLMILSFFFLTGALGLGMFISTVAHSQVEATQLAMIVTFLPAYLLSGFMFAIDVMPAVLRGITFLVPARYFLVVTRGIFLKGVGVDVLRVQGLLMIAFSIVGFLAAVRVFRKELA